MFAYFVNPTKWPDWDVTVIDAAPSELPLRVGSEVRIRMRFLGREGTVERRVIVYERDALFVTLSLKPFPLTITWSFAPEDGGTRVVRDGLLKASGIVGVLSPILRRFAYRVDQRSLERMKTLIEAGER